jgi:ABC-type multidrug transport system ATPase subunit
VSGLAVEDLTLRRAKRCVLDRVSFDVRPGEIVAVIGANGAGKTSLLEALLGFLRVDPGRVTYDGRALADLPARARVFAYMPDDAEPPAEVGVAALLAHARRFGRASDALARTLVDGLGLSRLLSARAGELSRGEKRRVMLFAALCADRPVAVLDEPLGAFDPLQLLDVLDVLRARASAGQSLLVTVHQLSDAEKIASRVLLLDAGRVLAFGTVAELRERAGGGASSLEEIFLSLLKREARDARP